MGLSIDAARESLRGEEEKIFDLVRRTGSAEQWAQLLQAPLECAVEQQDERLAERFVEAGAGFGAAVHAAVRLDNEQIMDFLLENGASLHATDKNGDSILHVAASFDRGEITRSLLIKGANKNQLGRKRDTPLYRAAYHGNYLVVEDLLKAGADVGLRWQGLVSPLEIAAEHGFVEVMRVLIAHGADVNVFGPDHSSPLQSAVLGTRAEAVDLLVEAGAAVNYKGWMGFSLLHTACAYEERLEAAFALIKHGAEINATADGSVEGQTPLHVAAQKAGATRNAAAVVDLLLRHGADETMADKFGKRPIDRIGESDLDLQPLFPQDFQRALGLLVNAPADRAWRRRGMLVLCRAHRNRLQGCRRWMALPQPLRVALQLCASPFHANSA